MKNGDGHFAPELGGHFELESGGHFKLELGGQYHWNLHRDKLFMDVAGNNMDFWSLHLYDFPAFGGKVQLRSGSNIEATFDMMDQYSTMKFGVAKPYVVSEYGAQVHDLKTQQWSSKRDWMIIKAINSQLMAFLERPNLIDIAIPFVVTKGEWGFANGVPYNPRLLRKVNEPTSYTGQWIYSDLVKFYDLWKNVKGTRVYIKPDNLDVLANAYIDGNKGYVILNNLNFQPTTVNLNLFDTNNVTITSINKKHLTLVNNITTLEETIENSSLSSVTLGAESTIILEYTFASPITVNETSNETKYFATTNLQPIVANQPINFQVNDVQKNTYGEATLRIGLGRNHGQSLSPVIKVNNTIIPVPTNFRGYDQAQRERFFGVLEIPVPYNLLTTNNQISVQLSDTGGHVSSVALQVFNFSKNILSVND